MNERLRLKLKKLLIIVFVWLGIGILQAFYDYFVVLSGFSKGISEDLSFPKYLLLCTTAATLGALMGGTFLVFYVNEKYRDKPYWFTVSAVIGSFIVVVSIITCLLALIAALLQTGKFPDNSESKKLFLNYLVDPLHAKNIIVWSGVVGLTQAMLQFNTKFGEGNLWKMITGKYQTPKNESRIVMFADIDSSTTIAENLGDEQYHYLLRDFFSDITNAILENKGEVYQYVGDEIVITWRETKAMNYECCLNCFRDMQHKIVHRSKYYLSRYGLVPSFKAGIHFGPLVAGEVGVIKRDITFSGDVLNTTSRILSKCKELGVELIVSADLIQKLDTLTRNKSVVLGSIPLRGKQNPVGLHTISQL